MEIDRIVDGVRHPWVTTDEILEAMKTFEVRQDDIWVIAYPKSGSTWMQEIISILFHGCDFEKADEEDMRIRFNFLDIKRPRADLAPHVEAASKPSPRLMKTHLPRHQMAREINTKNPKIVYVARNPKDTAVSFYHFHQSVKVLRTYESWNNFYEAFRNGDVQCGSWFDMNLYWWSRRNDDNVLFVKYEDMQKDLGSVVVKVSEFLGFPIIDGKLQDIVHHCSFTNMKNNPKTNYSNSLFKTSPFMRKGEVGDWKNHFTVSQNEEFDKVYTERMTDSSLTFQYEL